MSLTKKDKEEIKQLVVEAIAECNPGAEKVEQGASCFNMLDGELPEEISLEQLDKKWLENGIKSKSTGLIIAPKDVDIDGVTTFTWDEAMRLGAEGKTPKGWRLPTRHEWALICEEFGMDEATGELSTEKLSKALNLPRDEDGWLRGHFWSSTAYSGSTYAFTLNYAPSYVYPQGTSYKYYGFSVRLVKEVGND